MEQLLYWKNFLFGHSRLYCLILLIIISHFYINTIDDFDYKHDIVILYNCLYCFI